nr:PREDICTED: rRNA-processing protein EFG1-like [Latimeria chalumnae]|eukprot:XP_014339269.1 PREDICTED: rRNA-processing protein EFG1-like [Latimeria chalumnae]
MFVDFMWQNMRLTGQSSDLQHKEVETAGDGSFFAIDKSLSGGQPEGGASDTKDKVEEEEGDSEEESAEEQEEENDSDDDVSAAKKGNGSGLVKKPLVGSRTREFKENLEPSSESEGEMDTENRTDVKEEAVRKTTEKKAIPTRTIMTRSKRR